MAQIEAEKAGDDHDQRQQGIAVAAVGSWRDLQQDNQPAGGDQRQTAGQAIETVAHVEGVDHPDDAEQGKQQGDASQPG